MTHPHIKAAAGLCILLASLLAVVAPARADRVGTGIALSCSVPPGCAVAGGRYLALAPSGWDGKVALPVLVFFHGWRESAEYVVQDAPLRALVEKRGALLIAPHGEGNTWSYPGAPGRHRDEFAFIAALVVDVKARFPVDARRFVAAGFSQGASMVWNSACRQPHLFTVHGALAGGFWEPSPDACPGGTVDLVHVHGTRDGTVPMGGRALRGGLFRQADIRRDWAVWLSGNACPALPSTTFAQAGRTCLLWSACARPGHLQFCTHDSGHEIHESDLEVLWAFVEQRALSR
ncbi:MAG: alpha/beta hydrolase-fold protein [Beijerinckiaceae bacterium]|jgi:polyhydroxybutyrate depolymerase|nr:alpha/beta hydrolase-fold protein [Beijerinckiaceae bacterium]